MNKNARWGVAKEKLTGIGKASDEENEKLVGSLMFLKNGHLRMESSSRSPGKKSIFYCKFRRSEDGVNVYKKKQLLHRTRGIKFNQNNLLMLINKSHSSAWGIFQYLEHKLYFQDNAFKIRF